MYACSFTLAPWGREREGEGIETESNREREREGRKKEIKRERERERQKASTMEKETERELTKARANETCFGRVGAYVVCLDFRRHTLSHICRCSGKHWEALD